MTYGGISDGSGFAPQVENKCLQSHTPSFLCSHTHPHTCAVTHTPSYLCSHTHPHTLIPTTPNTVPGKSLVTWVQIGLKCPSNIFLINIFFQEMAHFNPKSFWNNALVQNETVEKHSQLGKAH